MQDSSKLLCVRFRETLVANFRLFNFTDFFFFFFYRLEREKSNLYQDLMSSKAMYDKINVEKALLDRELKSCNQKFQDVQLRLDEAGRNLSDLEIIRNKLTSQNLEFERKLDEAETQTSQLSKLKVIFLNFVIKRLALICSEQGQDHHDRRSFPIRSRS